MMENIVSSAMMYITNPLLPHGTKKCVEKLSEYIDQQNELVFRPLGLRLINPASQALMQLEFHFIL